MSHPVLLISADVRLQERVRRALPATLPLELHCAASLEAAAKEAAGDAGPGTSGWLLILLDARVFAPGTLAEELVLPGEGAPVLWLSERPGMGELEASLPVGRGQVIDYLHREVAPSKLAFVLQQHLATAYLRRLRQPQLVAAAAGDAEALQRQLNNALTGILGNAALAIEAGRRLPAPLGRRLQRIAELASQMRAAMNAQAMRLPAPAPPPAAESTARPKAA